MENTRQTSSSHTEKEERHSICALQNWMCYFFFFFLPCANQVVAAFPCLLTGIEKNQMAGKYSEESY